MIAIRLACKPFFTCIVYLGDDVLCPNELADSLYLTASTCIPGSRIKIVSATDAAERHNVPSGVSEKACYLNGRTRITLPSTCG